MELTIGNELYIQDPSPELLQWARQNLVFENPEYINRKRRGFWTDKDSLPISRAPFLTHMLSKCRGPAKKWKRKQ